MTTTKQEHAFPLNTTYGKDFTQPGLTKREYFAAMAMQGLIANEGATLRSTFPTDQEAGAILCTAKRAVCLADDLIDELNKEPAKE